MLTTGNQLRAARALVGMDQGTLAERAGVNINTVGAMEKRGAAGLVSGLDKIQAVMRALEAEGVVFLNHGEPGVRLRMLKPVPAPDPSKVRKPSRPDIDPDSSGHDQGNG